MREAIDSCLAQSYACVEVVVVDDGSTDNSREIIREYGGRIRSVLKTNGGQASTVEAGFCASHGEILCLLDADDVFFPEKVRSVVEVFGAHPDVDWCFHALEYVNADRSRRFRVEPESAEGRHDFRESMQRTGRLRFAHPATSGLCFRRTLFERAMPMPELRTLADNFLKFVASGIGVGYFVGAPLGQLRVHGTNAYSDTADRPQKNAVASVEIASTMSDRWPEFYRFTDRLMARVLGLTWHGAFLPKGEERLLRDYISALSLPRRLRMYGQASVYFTLALDRERMVRSLTRKTRTKPQAQSAK